MAGRRKPTAGKKPAAGGCGCLTVVLLPIIIPLAIFLWVCGAFTGGILGAAFHKPPRGE